MLFKHQVLSLSSASLRNYSRWSSSFDTCPSRNSSCRCGDTFSPCFYDRRDGSSGCTCLSHNVSSQYVDTLWYPTFSVAAFSSLLACPRPLASASRLLLVSLVPSASVVFSLWVMLFWALYQCYIIYWAKVNQQCFLMWHSSLIAHPLSPFYQGMALLDHCRSSNLTNLRLLQSWFSSS